MIIIQIRWPGTKKPRPLRWHTIKLRASVVPGAPPTLVPLCGMAGNPKAPQPDIVGGPKPGEPTCLSCLAHLTRLARRHPSATRVAVTS